MWILKRVFFTEYSFKPIKELAKMFRYIWSSRERIKMDHSEGNGCLPYDLLIAKLVAYGFGNMALALITDYLTNHLQWVKIASAFSLYLAILIGVLQGSILGPILFNLIINDLMFSSRKHKSAILLMIIPYIHVH